VKRTALSALPIGEADVAAGVLDYLRLRGIWYFRVRGALGQRRGLPDIVAIVGGRFIGIEVKRPGGRLGPHQRRELLAIVAAGGLALVAEDVAQVITALERLSLADGGRG